MKILDVAKLVKTIKETEAEIRGVKALLRTRWERGMGREQWQLLTLKRRATTLVALRAASRGRRHPIKLDDAAYEAFIASVRAEFEITPPSAEVVKAPVLGLFEQVGANIGAQLTQAFGRIFG